MINNTYLEMQLAQNIPDSQHLFNIQKCGKIEGCQRSHLCIRSLIIVILVLRLGAYSH